MDHNDFLRKVEKGTQMENGQLSVDYLLCEFDSLDKMLLVGVIDEEYNIVLKPEAISKLEKISDLIKFIEEKLKG